MTSTQADRDRARLNDERHANDWSFAPAFETIAERMPDHRAIVHGDRVVSWAEFDAHAEAVAADMRAAGLSHQGKVAVWTRNRPEYLESCYAAFKGRFVPFNCNYRYGRDEMRYVLDNGDAEAVVLESAFLETATAIRDDLPEVRRWYVVRDSAAASANKAADEHVLPPWATDFGSVARRTVGTSERSLVRHSDDLLLLYTGGTTGMPKGVMWRQGDLVNILGRGGNRPLGIEPAKSFEHFVDRLDATGPGPAMLVATPLMHGTGQFSALQTLMTAGTVVLLTSASLDVAELWQAAADNRVSSMVVVGQTFGDPMLRHLREHFDRYDLSALRLITSSGVMWSEENKAGFLELLPEVTIFDNYGSSEAVGVGGSVSQKGATAKDARFRLGARSAVFTEDGRRVEPGSAEQGLLAVTGFIPLGYYKDDEKTQRTFRTFEGRRWSIPGDWAEVESDGTVRLLGRGSSCINSGGEKIFPEEIEEVLKRHTMVRDAAVVGVPDAKFGEAVCALVEPRPGAGVGFEQDLPAFVRQSVASFKVPRHVVVVDTLDRGANGKLDHARLKQIALAHVVPTDAHS